MGTRVAVAGASGYAGGELLRLIAAHPEFELITATAHGSSGELITDIHPHLLSLTETRFADTTPATLSEAELVFLALPHGASGSLAAALPSSVKVVDLGADHRLKDPEIYRRYYGVNHPGTWTYGLPELPGQRERISESSRVANTGCYAVATITALAPVLAAGIGAGSDVVVVAASGTSGAGTTARRGLLASEVVGDLSPYKVGRHQHVPEIKQATGATSLSFTPILAPMPRGILATVTARATRAVAADEVRDVLAAAYRDDPFVHVLAEGRAVHTKATYGSNSVVLQADVDVDSGRIIVTSAIDNLGKGAAGQAIQNANLILGLPETTGLSVEGIAP